MKKSLAVMFLSAGLAGFVQADAVEDTYNKSCAACHASGAAGAPVAHNTGAWAPRMEKGMDTLMNSVHNGFNAMPPKGMCFDCTDDQFKALIEFMAAPKS